MYLYYVTKPNIKGTKGIKGKKIMDANEPDVDKWVLGPGSYWWTDWSSHKKWIAYIKET